VKAGEKEAKPMAWFDLAVPGYAVVPSRGGPDVFNNVFDLAWTDQQGLRRTTDALFVGKEGQTSFDFHFPFTTPITFGDGSPPVRMTIHAVVVTFHMPSSLVLVDRIRVFDRLALIFDTLPAFGPLGLTSPTAFMNSGVLNRNLHGINGLPVFKSIGVTVTVNFGSGVGAGGRIEFTGAGIQLTN
jgi:hypothetical protein